MRQPLRGKGQAPRSQISGVFSVSAPVGGWNARDSLANMNPGDATKLVNWFPRTTDCILRGGQEDFATGITGLTETLAVYNKLDGSSEMFAVDDNDVWDVSSSGAASAQSTTVTDGKFQTINYGDGTNNYLIMVNGVDAPLYYNGTTWVVITGVSSPSLAGVTLTDLVHVNEYKGRLVFIEKDSLSFWYLPAGAAGGTLIEFDLSSFCNRGGYLMWSATWSFDSGDGPDDAIAFMTSEGEVVVYRGTDPSTASNWVLTGVFFLGKPLGRRSFTKYGGDLVAITQNGAFPLSKSLKSSSVDNTTAMTNKIESAFNEASRSYGANFGWEGTVYPAQSAILFNIPVIEGSTHKQYVMNTITNAWCEFDSWDGECFVEYNKDLYYGGSTVVRKAWSGTGDDGSDIVAEGKAAFNYFGQTSQLKRFNFFRPLLQVNGSITFLTGMDVDFTDNDITGTSSFTVPSSGLWDSALWDQANWQSGTEVVRQWTSPSNNVGYSCSGGIKVNTKDLTVKWIASDYVYERGGVL